MSARELVTAWARMAPWLLAAFLAAAALAGPPGVQLLVFAGASVLVVPAAARAAGLHAGRGLGALVVERAFTHLANVLTMVVLTAFAAALGGTAGGMAADLLGLGDAGLLAGALALLAALPIVWWHWPALVLAFVAPEGHGVRRPDTGAWRGPRYGHARALVRTVGRPGRAALVVGFLLLWTTFVAVTTGGPARDPLRLLSLAASCALFYPLTVWLAVVETRRMIAAAA